MKIKTVEQLIENVAEEGNLPGLKVVYPNWEGADGSQKLSDFQYDGKKSVDGYKKAFNKNATLDDAKRYISNKTGIPENNLRFEDSEGNPIYCNGRIDSFRAIYDLPKNNW